MIEKRRKVARIRLIHHDPRRGAEQAAWLNHRGYQTEWEIPVRPNILDELAGAPPEAILIDLSRRPAQGRDLAIALRVRSRTRGIPIVFLGGQPAKVNQIRTILPDAVFTTWEALPGPLDNAITEPLQDPVVPASVFAGYAGTPLVKKLGIKEGMHVALVGAPANFPETLGPLPPDVRLQDGPQPGCALTIWFAESKMEVRAEIQRIADLVGDGAVWIGWKKKASGQMTDLTQQLIRDSGLEIGLVDYKICSIDSTWSALLFTRRKLK